MTDGEQPRRLRAPGMTCVLITGGCLALAGVASGASVNGTPRDHGAAAVRAPGRLRVPLAACGGGSSSLDRHAWRNGAAGVHLAFAQRSHGSKSKLESGRVLVFILQLTRRRPRTANLASQHRYAILVSVTSPGRTRTVYYAAGLSSTAAASGRLTVSGRYRSGVLQGTLPVDGHPHAPRLRITARWDCAASVR